MPHKSSVSMGWRLKGERYGLVGAKCLSCGVVYFPPVGVCKNCGDASFKKEPVSNNGVIESFTVLHAAPVGFTAPYIVGLVRLDSGQLISTQIVGGGVDMGVGVHAVFRKLRVDGVGGLIHYSFKFVVSD